MVMSSQKKLSDFKSELTAEDRENLRNLIHESRKNEKKIIRKNREVKNMLR